MRLKGQYRYFARLSGEEVEIIKTALELLLESYEAPNLTDHSYYTDRQPEASVKQIVEEFDECA
jgi:hypothetical protein